MAYLLSGRAGCRTCTTGALIAVSVDGAASKPGTLYPGAGDLMIIDAVSITAPYRAPASSTYFQHTCKTAPRLRGHNKGLYVSLSLSFCRYLCYFSLSLHISLILPLSPNEYPPSLSTYIHDMCIPLPLSLVPPLYLYLSLVPRNTRGERREHAPSF